MGIQDTVISSWFQDKVEYTRGYKESPRPFYYHITKIKRSDVREIRVSGYGFLGNSEYFFRSRNKPRNPDIVINGDEGHYAGYEPNVKISVPKGFGISEGVIYKNVTDEETLQFDQNSQLLGAGWKIIPGAWNAFAGSNVVLKDGKVNTVMENTSVDPRQSFFWNATHYFIITIDGRNNGTSGLLKSELAEFALTVGATDGINLDGGDSCQTLYRNGENSLIINNPPDATLHSVVQMVGIWLNLDETQPDDDVVIGVPDDEVTGGTMYDVKVIKQVRKRYSPDFFASYDSKDPDAVLGFEFSTDTTHYDNNLPDGAVNDVTWYRMPDGKWCPDRNHTNEDVYLQVSNVTPPPDDNPKVILKVEYFDDGRLLVNGEEVDYQPL